MKKHIYLPLVISCAFVGVLLLTVQLLQYMGIFSCLPIGGTGELTAILSGLFTLLALGLLTLWFWKHSQRRWVRILGMILLLMAMLLSGIGHGLDYVIARNSVSREAITSPDGRYTLVLEQQTFYHTKSCTAYLMTSSVTMKKLGSWQWDIATCPEVTWEGDHVVVRGEGKTRHFCLED